MRLLVIGFFGGLEVLVGSNNRMQAYDATGRESA